MFDRPKIAMGLHNCNIQECNIFAEVVVGGRTFIFDEEGFRRFVEDFNDQVERVLPLDPTLRR